MSTYATKAYSDAGDVTTLDDSKAYTDAEIAGIPAPDLSSYATKVYSDAGDATTESNANNYTNQQINNLPASVQLDNTSPWTQGQYNEYYQPSVTAGGAVTPLFANFSAEEYPNIKIYHNTAETSVIQLQPNPPAKAGVFMSVTWIPYGNQIMILELSAFDESCRPWETPEHAETRVYVGLAGGLSKWYEVG